MTAVTYSDATIPLQDYRLIHDLFRQQRPGSRYPRTTRLYTEPRTGEAVSDMSPRKAVVRLLLPYVVAKSRSTNDEWLLNREYTTIWHRAPDGTVTRGGEFASDVVFTHLYSDATPHHRRESAGRAALIAWGIEPLPDDLAALVIDGRAVH